MRIVVCVKEVLDPDAVNNYALAGNLTMGADGKTPQVSAIPTLINGYDEQAIEAALRLRDAGVDCTITAVSIGQDLKALLKQCAALGADEIVGIDADLAALDSQVTANILAAYIQSSGGADLVLCGRQASDDDQGVVPALIGEYLSMPVVPLARAVEASGSTLTVTRATPDGDEVVQGQLPAVVTVSNELGDPRFPTAKAKMAARKKKPTSIAVADLGLSPEQLAPRVILEKQYVPQVQGNCEFLEGSPAEIARTLVEKLRADSLI
ncbi:electron transfer flavoprotein subunit beta/FixA family protein [Seongchinamella sediminis]|uniref:Electron transfer flavoprotein subunit beta/FixA family protein n=1 Tax=Seongchinamella sediminis TaxID=2283635 RepID=A0A3L7DVB9_9GAMM|nr:electron transfer flavoprotein subunit beta/FixA family protein [Seongchinamella sediminis]RLQ21066.1 electron transfer flavoprotein subunit beta/FixA family protein [Seongchinamella sediminis]